ncbi:MAG: S-layer homology domain-containing protein [Lachnospirales bacterium]
MKRIKALFLVIIMILSVCMFNSASVYATDARSVINSAKLYPCKTGVIEVDQKVNEILSELRKTNKDTYSLVRAVYTYIVQNTDYGYNKESVADSIVFHKDYLYETAIPDYVTDWAIDTIFDHQGLCNSYNSAMIVFARAIGLEAYYFGGETHAASGGFIPHAWCEIKINGKFYVFDPNVDYSIYNSRGTIMYLYFCKTEEEMKDKYKWYPENNEKYLATFGEVKPENERITPPEYIYDKEDEVPSLPINLLNDVDDTDSAVYAVEEAVRSTQYKDSGTIRDYLALYAEEAISKASEISVSENEININDSVISDAVNTANNTARAINGILSNQNINRELRKNVRIVTSTNETVKVNKEKMSKYKGNVSVVTPYCSTMFSADDNMNVLIESKSTSKVSVSFDNKTSLTKVSVSFPNITTEGYKAVLNAEGEAIGGKYNPITKELSAKINESGIYSVANNEKDFADIKDKANEMQNAIKLLASKGIINGTSTTEFSPDKSISRAEVAAIILRTISKLDPNADGGFVDVEKADWFYGVAGSSKNAGIIKGYEDNTFRGKVVIPKVQIVSVISRVLKEEMNYKDVNDAEDVLLNNYRDSEYIAQWAKSDVALATYSNMVLRRNDYKFAGDEEMTRGDAAILLKRLFDKLW